MYLTIRGAQETRAKTTPVIFLNSVPRRDVQLACGFRDGHVDALFRSTRFFHGWPKVEPRTRRINCTALRPCPLQLNRLRRRSWLIGIASSCKNMQIRINIDRQREKSNRNSVPRFVNCQPQLTSSKPISRLNLPPLSQLYTVPSTTRQTTMNKPNIPLSQFHPLQILHLI